MIKIHPDKLAILLPLSIFIHQVEEYLGGFASWFSRILGVQFSNQDFLLINGIGLILFVLLSLTYFLNKNKLILIVLGTMVFVNGLIHFFFTVITRIYSPGTISGVFLFIPLGVVIFHQIIPETPKGKNIVAIAIGLSILFIAAIFASSI